ncbi:MAG: class I SAM-dependent methyltransferase [Actinomycetota bacterium]|nr:class I SAM-dependent methyltransferase [Actinomycetota bacterium]
MAAAARDRAGRYPPLAIRAQLRWAVVKPIVTQLAPARTIEVGVGQGAMGARIASMSTQSYVGVEIDAHSYEQAARRIEPFGGVVHNEWLSVVDPDPADLLCAFEVLEHIDDDAAALSEWLRYVRPGGHLLLSVPAHPHRFGPMDHHAGHFRRYAPDELRRLAESAGLVEVDTQLYGSPLGYGLEAVRNRIDARKLASVEGTSPEELTAASGRTFQFSEHSWKSAVATAGTFPFTYLQRVFPGGVGLVMCATKPPST